MATATSVMERVEAPRHAFTPTVRGWIARILVLLVIFGGTLFVTAVVPGYWADRIGLAVIFCVIGLSLNVVMGYVGQVSLGHHAFVGIAAFIAAYHVSGSGEPGAISRCTLDACSFGAFATATAIAALSGVLAAGLLGVVALRIKGLYLALITLAYGFVAERSVFEIPELTRGGGGMPATRPDGWATDTEFAFLCFMFLAAVIYLDWRFLRSKVGRAVLAIKHSEAVAASYGVNVTAYKVLAFMMSGLFAGIAGSLFAFHSTNVVSNNFSFSQATLWVLMVVVGGLGNRVGVIIGSAFFALFPFLLELIAPLAHYIEGLGRATGNVTLTVGALLAIFTMIQYPGGIGEQISPITRWLGGKRFSLHGDDHSSHDVPADKSGTGTGGLLSKLGLHRSSSGGDQTEELQALQRAVETPGPSSDPRSSSDDATPSINPPDVWGALVGSSKKRDE